MENDFLFKEFPKFKNPEEELNFLRDLVNKKEREARVENPEIKKETITKQTIEKYKEVPIQKVVEEANILPEHEAEQIVLRLRPESHDNKMEELLGLLLAKGIKNAFLLLEKIGNPHLDDDFHRFLVQYLQAGHNDLIKENSPVFKGVNMRLYEITLPELDKNEGRVFKDFIMAMEQFYSGMQSVGGRDNEEHNYFVLEIALSEQTDEVIFYAAIPNSRCDLFEKQILAFYQKAKIREVTDDYNIFNYEGRSAGAFAKMATHEVFPIKTYESIEHDPMNIILNSFSKLKTQGEGAAIQILIRPAGNKLVEKFNQVLKEVKEGIDLKNSSLFSDFDKRFVAVAKDLFFGGGVKDKDKKIDDKAVSLITEKTKSTINEINLRIVASANTKERAEEITIDLESTFNQFSDPNGNSFAFEMVKEKDLPDLFHDFSFRLFSEKESIPLNFKELSTVFHFPIGVTSTPQLKQAKAGISPAPMDMGKEGILLGVNNYRGKETEIHFNPEDRMRHFYVVGQTGTGKTTIMKNMIAQDIRNGDGCCYIDPHGTDIQDILSYVPKERIEDVIYFDPAYTARPMGLNMLEFDPKYPEQKTFVVNEMMSIFNKLFDMKVGGGAMFEQYFRNSAALAMEDVDSGSTLLEITRILSNKEFRDMKLAHCKNPIIKEFWQAAEQTTGDQGLANFVPYISSKFDPLISNEIMRPVVLQQKSSFDFRKIMDEKKILLVNLSKGRLGELNANLIGLILIGKIQMAALSRVDMYGQKMNDFYLYIDEFQNVTTDSIASILSEARKYRLSLNVAHQYINQLQENIKNAVFGNVGSMAIYRVSPEDAQFLESKVAPTFTAADITRLDNFNSYVNMLVKGAPTKPFNMIHLAPSVGNKEIVNDLKELSYLKYGRPREEVEEEIMNKYRMF